MKNRPTTWRVHALVLAAYAVLSLILSWPLAAKLAMSRFCRMLGTLLAAGVSLMNGLNVARRSLGYQILIDLVADASERVKKGESLADSLRDCRLLFPGSAETPIKGWAKNICLKYPPSSSRR